MIMDDTMIELISTVVQNKFGMKFCYELMFNHLLTIYVTRKFQKKFLVIFKSDIHDSIRLSVSNIDTTSMDKIKLKVRVFYHNSVAVMLGSKLISCKTYRLRL